MVNVIRQLGKQKEWKISAFIDFTALKHQEYHSIVGNFCGLHLGEVQFERHKAA